MDMPIVPEPGRQTRENQGIQGEHGERERERVGSWNNAKSWPRRIHGLFSRILMTSHSGNT